MKLTLTIISILVVLNSIDGIAFNKVTGKSDSNVDCDSYFNDVIQIEENMMDEFTDHELRDAYKTRNKNMTLCLDFFTKFLAKLDYYLDNIEGLDEESDEVDESAFNRDTRRIKAKHFWKRNQFEKSKKFW